MRRPVALLLLLLAACGSPPRTTPEPVESPSVADADRDGSTCERAVVIKASDEKAGVAAEYAWLRNHFPGYRMGSQSVRGDNGRMYDVLDFMTRDSEAKSVCFDITAFYGRW